MLHLNDQEKRIVKFGRAVLFGPAMDGFISLVRRYGLADGLEELIDQIDRIKESCSSKEDIDRFCQILISHTNPKVIANTTEPIGDEEGKWLNLFGWSLMRTLRSRNEKASFDFVQFVETVAREVCSRFGIEPGATLESWGMQDSTSIPVEIVQPIFPKVLLSQSNEELEPPLDTYFDWPKKKPLELLAKEVASKGWILDKDVFVSFLSNSSRKRIIVRCKTGSHYQLAYLIDVCKREGWLRVKGNGNGHFKLAETHLLDEQGQKLHSRFRSLPKHIEDNRANSVYFEVLTDVHDCFQLAGLASKTLCKLINCKSVH